MKLEHYISELLYRYECVTVPGFGAFLTSTQGARIQEATGAFYPPTKKLSFNKQITSNDGLLANYIATVEKLTYEIAMLKIETSVFEWEHTLKTHSELALKNIGDLWLNNESSIQFTPTEQVNYLASSFGLTTFVSPEIKREQLHKQVRTLEEKVPVTVTPEARKSPAYLKYAAIFVLGLSVAGYLGYNYNNTQQQEQLLVEQNAQEQVSKEIQQATFFEEIPLELTPVKINLTKETPSYKYHIVGGAFREKENANTKVNELKTNGFENAVILGENKFGLWQVSLQGFNDHREAERFLFKNRKNIEGIWLFIAE
ncbi:HU domain-containing protein [Neptunitalea lumnitzerae]|uniref:SPOR domain-containing protein n=1 Tax=Neptunitalea lumnitzerae TaxID=2965509 RepID=A0ABQ5MFC8_9FLAO|nr:SPOR domain-containing protein [Neptunitalea sp. Y10]GLB48099.1 hypothetical protein Y10_04670 [Neptunitalea sp. Y10]